MIEIKPMLLDQWQLHKSVRCAALADAPYAYSSTLADSLKRSDDDWARITAEYAADPNNITFFAFANDIPCGVSVCVIDGDEAEMFAVWVDPACRRKGIGSAHIDSACAWASLHGAQQLTTGVFDDNSGALAFYRAADFRDTGRTKPELSTENRTVILLAQKLA